MHVEKALFFLYLYIEAGRRDIFFFFFYNSEFLASLPPSQLILESTEHPVKHPGVDRIKTVARIDRRARPSSSVGRRDFFFFFLVTFGVRVSLRAPQLISGLTEHPASPVSM